MARLAAKSASPAPPLKPATSKQAVTPRLAPAQPRLQADVANPIQARINPPGPAGLQAAPTGGGFAGALGGEISSFADPMSELLTDVPTPAIPAANQEAGYLSMKAQLAQLMADRQAADSLLRSQYNTNYGDSLRTLGWNGDPTSGDWNPDDRQGYFGQAYGGLWDDFASRGTLNSGSFLDAQSNLRRDFGQRKTGLDTARGQYLAAQDQELGSFRNQNQTAEQDALIQAVARLAAQYGVDPSQVPRG